MRPPPQSDAGDAGRDASAVDGQFDAAGDVADASVGPGPFGAACVLDSECLSGICLSIGRCSRTCASGTDCPASSSWMCVGLPGRGTVCDCTRTSPTDLPCNRVDDDCNGQVGDTSRTCAGACVDVGSNAQNCGDCGIQCGGGTSCQNAHCVCPTDHPTICGTRCVASDTATATGTYTAFRGQEQLDTTLPGGSTARTGTGTVPAPVVVANPADIATGGVHALDYQSMLIQVRAVTATSATVGTDFTSRPAGQCATPGGLYVTSFVANDTGASPFAAVACQTYTSITGVLVLYSFGLAAGPFDSKLAPRTAADVVTP